MDIHRRARRGQKVMLDSDLAILYDVPTKALNQAVQRNLDRFPSDFMFQLSEDELQNWRSQTVTSNPVANTSPMRSQTVTASKRNIRHIPYAFTEHGVAMLSAVLRSERAVQMSILIMRAFVKLRELLTRDKDLARRIEKIEATQKDHHSMIAILAQEIDELKRLPDPKSKRIM